MGTRRRFSLAPAWQKKNAREDEEAIEADRAEKRATKEVLERLRSTWSA